MKRIISMALLLAVSMLALSGCDEQATVASRNLAKAADNFEISRRIVFVNGITDSYLLSIEGRCAFEVESGGQKVAVTCKVGEGTFKKHTLGLSDNVTFFSEQLESVPVNVYRYRVTFRPSVIIPDIKADIGF